MAFEALGVVLEAFCLEVVTSGIVLNAIGDELHTKSTAYHSFSVVFDTKSVVGEALSVENDALSLDDDAQNAGLLANSVDFEAFYLAARLFVI